MSKNFKDISCKNIQATNQFIIGLTHLISSASILRTLTFPDITDTIVTLIAPQTLTNKIATGATNVLTASVLRSTSTEINISSSSAPSNGQILVATSSTAATWQNPSVLTNVDVSVNETSSTTVTTTTATGYAPLGVPITVTPAAGTYLVIFSASFKISNGNSTVNFIIDVAGTTIAHSTRTLYFAGHQDDQSYMAGHTMAKITVNGTQSINVLFRTSLGTLTVLERCLTLISAS